MTFADDQIVYRDLAGLWGSMRLIVGGVDVTRFRDAPAQVGGYQLQEPYGYGPADFSFPRITALEVDQFGTGALSWFDAGKTVELVQADDSGERVRTIWRGFVSVLNPTVTGTNVHCDGAASGRLALKDKHPELFTWIKDSGILLYNAFRGAGLSVTPRQGLVTGIELDERRLSGGTLLSYCDEVLAQTMTGAGDQLTVMPAATGSGYTQLWKDRETVHFTVFTGAAGVAPDVHRDLAEEPTTFYGSGRDPDGVLWVNGKYPGLVQGNTPTFPGSLSLGATGEDVRVLQDKLIGMGYLDGDDAVGDEFNAATEQAVKDLQDDAGLSQTGVVNSATWDSLFDLNDTGLSLARAHVAPIAQLSAVCMWNRTSNGSKASLNPGYDPARIAVDRTLDGFGAKKKAIRWAKRELDRVQTGKNWVGTYTLEVDVTPGDHTHGTTPAALMSRLDIMAGQNFYDPNFDGGTLFHVSGVNVDSDLTVRLAVDTKARDLLTVGQIIERNRASRVSASRQWLREHRGTGANQQIVEATEHFGRIWMTVDCQADGWTVFPVIAGQSGSVNRLRVKVTSSECEFVVAVLARRVSAAWCQNKFGNPFGTGKPWQSEKVRAQVDDARVLLGAWGDESQPGGYYPGSKTDDAGDATSDPLTGVLLDDGGFDYHTFDEPVIYVAVYAKQACKIKPQRVLWPVLEAGM